MLMIGRKNIHHSAILDPQLVKRPKRHDHVFAEVMRDGSRKCIEDGCDKIEQKGK